MNRKELENLIVSKYAAEPEFLWKSAPSFAVFRHKSNKKWFACIMTITKDKLGLETNDPIDVVNLKCDPLMNATAETGIFPAYHMSKTHWITVALDGSVEKEKLEWLLDLSFDLTNYKSGIRK